MSSDGGIGRRNRLMSEKYLNLSAPPERKDVESP